MSKVARRLRELGKYEDSIVVFQADHGPPFRLGRPLLDEPWSLTDPALLEQIEGTNLRRERAEQLDFTPRALLLIKPPGKLGTPMIISDRAVQLVDIPNTLYDLARIDVRTPDGISVFADNFPARREQLLFIGLYRPDESGALFEFGSRLQEGELNVYGYTPGVGWKVHPDIRVRR